MRTGLERADDRGRRTVRFLILTNAIVILLIIGVLSSGLVRDRARIVADAENHARNLRDALAEHTRQTFSALDIALRSIVEDVDTTALDSDQMHRPLAARQNALASTFAVYIVDEEGRAIASSRTPAPEPVDLSGHQVFSALRDGPDAGIRIGSPRKGTVGYSEDEWIVTVGRRLSHPDGRFAGMVAAAVSLEYLISFYEALRVGEQGVVGLATVDGILVARAPLDEKVLGRRLDDTVLFQERLPESDAGVYRATFRVSDGVDRVAAYGRVPDLPFAVYVGISMDERLADWWHRVARDVAGGLLAIVLVLGISVLTVRRVRERQRENEARVARISRLADGSADLVASDSVGTALQRVTDLARELVPAHQALTSLTEDDSMAQAIHAVSLSDKYAAWRGYHEKLDGSGIYRLVCEANRPMSMTQAELETHPAWRAFGEAKDRHPPMRGWLAVPLTDGRGGNLGLIQLSDRETGEFTAEDEALVVELAHIASAAIRNLRLQEAHEAAHREIERIFTLISDSVLALDREWRLTYVNERAVEVLGFPRTELIGRNIWEVFPKAIDSPLYAQYHRAVEEGVEVDFQYFGPTLGRWLHVRAFPDEDGLTLGEQYDMRFVLGRGLSHALIDPGQLENAILNLALNSRDAMPDGGKLTIETGEAVLDGDYVRDHPYVVPGRYILVAVADTGFGMTSEVRSRVFEPFFTTKKHGEGTGLGLSMVYGFVKQSGGHVNVYSEPGNGTVVKLYLPLAEHGISAEEMSGASHGVADGTERILLVEDDMLVREHTAAMLRSLGYDVVAVADGVAALEIVERDRAFDLLLSDVILAGTMNGRQVAEAVVERLPDLPVLYMSGYTENVIVHHGRLDPGTRLLSKPFRREELARKLREVLDRSA